jgi:electron transfer flavoprotein beta subunit
MGAMESFSEMVRFGKGPAAAPPTPGPASPLVVACLDPADLRPEVNPLTGEVLVDGRRADLSAPDAAALEYALRAGQIWGGRVVAVAAGPATVEPVLRQAVALGAQALRVPYGATGSSGPEPLPAPELAGEPATIAAAVGSAIEQLGSPALVVCGDRSPWRGIGAVPALIAHHLGAAQALGLVSLSFDEDALTVHAERRLDGGWRERLRLRAPAVCSVEAAGVKLRRASLVASLSTADQPIPVAAVPVVPAAAVPIVPVAAVPIVPTATSPVGPAAGAGVVHVGAPEPYRPRTKVVPAPSGDTRDRLLALTGALKAHDPPRLVGPVGPEEGAEELLSYLAAHGYLPSARDRG